MAVKHNCSIDSYIAEGDCLLYGEKLRLTHTCEAGEMKMTVRWTSIKLLKDQYIGFP